MDRKNTKYKNANKITNKNHTLSRLYQQPHTQQALPTTTHSAGFTNNNHTLSRLYQQQPHTQQASPTTTTHSASQICQALCHFRAPIYQTKNTSSKLKQTNTLPHNHSCQNSPPKKNVFRSR